jgi:hypothetical protein
MHLEDCQGFFYTFFHSFEVQGLYELIYFPYQEVLHLKPLIPLLIVVHFLKDFVFVFRLISSG